MIEAEGGTGVPFACDVTSSGECQKMVEVCIAAFGRVDVLHNNVGVTFPGGPVELAEEQWDRLMRINVKSMFLTCKHTLPHMERQGGGAIVNIASINAIRTLPAIAIAYAASKAAVIALTREVAVQYAPKGVRANAILPGLMDTPMVKAQLTSAYGGQQTAPPPRSAARARNGHDGVPQQAHLARLPRW